MKHPAETAWDVIDGIMHKGSSKDGCNETWRDRDIMYHLSKAQAHLATHIKQTIDPRTADDENHLHLAITRLAMALCIADTQNRQS